MKKTKETIFQYLYSNAVICSLIVFSSYPICIYFSCTFSLGPQPILGERSSVSHWNDSSSLEGAPVSSLSHSERLAPLAEFRWALLARLPKALRLCTSSWQRNRSHIYITYVTVHGSSVASKPEACLMTVWVQTQQSKTGGIVHISADAVDRCGALTFVWAVA